jgi:subtilisin family serine protease
MKMGKSVSFMTLTSAIGFAMMGAGLQSSADVHAAEFRASIATQTVDTSVAGQTAGIQTYIITFAEAGLLHYTGGVSGIQSTAPLTTDGHRKLEVHTSVAHAYTTYLADQRNAHVASINSALGRALNVTHRYAITANGIAADLSAAEAATVATVPGVKSVRLAGEQHLVTYRGPKFIGADRIWDGTDTPTHVGTKGQGILVGDLDTGTNSGHPSFANDPICGFRASAPKVVAVDCSATDVNGFCDGPDPEANPGFGHGVHTSSTIAGNTIDNTVTPAPVLPNGVTMSGVAPCAAIHQYKVCQTNSCAGADIFAGIQNAIADQVDVLNFSISGGTDPWNDNDRDFLNAVGADVFIAAAAGNLQAGQTDPHGLVNHLGPWLMTVAASTQDQLIGPQLTVTGPGTVPAGLANIPLNPGSTTNTATTTDLTGQTLRTYPANIIGCTTTGAFPANYFQGTIAVLRRGSCTFTEKITNASAAGATMVLIGNNVAGVINMDTTGAPATPAFSIEGTTGDVLIAFVNSTEPAAPPADQIFKDGFEPAVSAGGAIGNYNRAVTSSTQGDVLAGFSDRGPTPAPTVDSTKPDISAPGVNIYAASDPASGNYQFMSGTSMATPHVTGAGALVRAVHPGWTVEEVKSALMMSATNANGVEEDGTTPWTIDDVGSGRVDLTKAALAGLTMDETYANFLAANPSAIPPGDVRTLNLPELRDIACATTCTWTRTVKNRLATSGTWNVTSTTDPGFAIAALPSTFTLAPGATQAITFTATPSTSLTAMTFGTVKLTEAAGQSPVQHITVAIRGGGTPPPPPSVVCSAGNCTFKIDGLPATGGTFNSLGCGAPPCTFLWLNRFSPAPTDYPITLNTVQTIFSSTGTTVGDTFDIYIYQDTDNDPSNGATFKGSVLGQAVAAAQNSLQTITIPGGLALTGSGDILIALVTRTPSPYPGSADNGVADQQRSWIGGLGGPIANPPDLSTLSLAHPGDLVPGFTHNWIIRANGTNGSSQPVVLGSGLPRNK